MGRLFIELHSLSKEYYPGNSSSKLGGEIFCDDIVLKVSKAMQMRPF